MNNDRFCGYCGNKLNVDWLVCSGCGKLYNENSMNCIRCYHIIDADATFCPFCGIQQVGKKVKDIIVEPVSKILPIDIGIPFAVHSNKVEKNHIFGSLKFNSESTYHVLGGEKYTRLSILIIILAGFVGAVIATGIQIVFSTGDGNITDVIKGFIFIFGIQTGILFSIAFFSRNVLAPLNYEVTYYHFIRYVSIFGIALIIKDIFMIPTIAYIYSFEGTGGEELAMWSYIILLYLVIAFLFVHFLALIRNLTGTNNTMSFIILITIVGLTAIFTMYMIGILDGMLRM